MFKSKSRPIVVPQFEHLRLVGTLALLWGNDQFDLPPIERRSMVVGMGFHDRGYGVLDNHAIGGMSDEVWYGIARRGFYTQYPDVIADTITKYHIRRLASHGESAEHQAMTAEFSQVIEAQLRQHHLSQQVFDRIDRITNLTDRISFDFCMDVPDSGEVSIYPRNEENDEVVVRYYVEEGVIHVTPWPFSIDEHKGYLVAYQADGYPERLDPVILPFCLERN